MNAIQTAARLIRAVQKAWGQRWLFLVAFLFVFFGSFSTLIAFDVVPEAKNADAPKVTLTASPLVAVSATPLSPNVIDAFVRGEEPVNIEIPSIDLSAQVANPTTTNIETLDAYLLKSVVRYPGSGLLGKGGNVVLFGHSSYLPVVHNSAYKLFNNIQKLKKGDKILVSSSTRTYVYAVQVVEKKNAESAAIPLNVSGSKLTLSTCDSFGEKSDRFVVTATLVESHPLGA